MAKIITDIQCRIEHHPNEVRTGMGERKIFNFGTPPNEWPKWNPSTDALVRGRPTQYVVRITEMDKKWRTTTRELVSETPPPELCGGDIGDYVASLADWPHSEARH